MAFSKAKLLSFGAYIALLSGLAIGLAALVAPLGVWLGLWEFGTGFQILGMVNPFTHYVALFSLILGIILLVIAIMWKTGNAASVLTLSLAGALAAGLAWYIPTTFQAPDGQTYPPIHDVSTDIENPLEYVAILPLRANAPNTVVYGGSPNMTPETLAELQTEAYPDLIPRYYDEPEEEVFNRALTAVNEMGWELIVAIPEEGRIEAVATTFWFRFKDDVVIRIQPENGQVRVDARSLSRVGVGDAGANAKRLRAFFEIL